MIHSQNLRISINQNTRNMRKFIQSTTYCFEKVIKKSLKQPEKSAQRNRRKHDIRAVEGLFENVLSLCEKKKKKLTNFLLCKHGFQTQKWPLVHKQEKENPHKSMSLSIHNSTVPDSPDTCQHTTGKQSCVRTSSYSLAEKGTKHRYRPQHRWFQKTYCSGKGCWKKHHFLWD